MLIFHCTTCDECISAAENESPGLILDKIEGHAAKCFGAQYAPEAFSESARQRALSLRHVWTARPIAGRIRWP